MAKYGRQNQSGIQASRVAVAVIVNYGPVCHTLMLINFKYVKKTHLTYAYLFICEEGLLIKYILVRV